MNFWVGMAIGGIIGAAILIYGLLWFMDKMSKG